jgi:HEAT repeat protein
LEQVIAVNGVTCLLPGLSSPDLQLRGYTTSMLEKYAWQPGEDEFAARYWIVRRRLDLCAKIGTPAVEPLISELQDGRDVSLLADALGEIGDPRAVAPLIAWLGKGSDTLQERVREALVRIGAPAVEELIAALQEQAQVDHAAIALGEISDPRAVQPLLQVMYKYTNMEERTATIVSVAVDHIGEVHGLSVISDALRSTDDDVRCAANASRSAPHR